MASSNRSTVHRLKLRKSPLTSPLGPPLGPPLGHRRLDEHQVRVRRPRQSVLLGGAEPEVLPHALDEAVHVRLPVGTHADVDRRRSAGHDDVGRHGDAVAVEEGRENGRVIVADARQQFERHAGHRPVVRHVEGAPAGERDAVVQVAVEAGRPDDHWSGQHRHTPSSGRRRSPAVSARNRS
jgi:hypothetical protein